MTQEDTSLSTPPIGVIDIGSNSVRLVVFEGGNRNPVSIFNERVLAGLGRNIASTGHLYGNGVTRGLRALERFRAVSEALGVKKLIVVATAAVRDAVDGPAFAQQASQLCGTEIRVLSGKEEASYTAMGVLCGMPDAHGLVGDLGGGSLEVLSLDKGKIGSGTTIPIGGLRLMDVSQGDINEARRAVDNALSNAPWIDHVKGNIYAVGGAWRVLARIHMAQHNYDLHVLQNYVMSRKEALEIAHLVSEQSNASLKKWPKISRRRLESLPFSAVVLERLLLRNPADNVIISAFGLREGLLYESLPEKFKKLDPLILSCREMALRLSRVPVFELELISWTQELFEDMTENTETFQVKRLREAICLLSDIEWRSHPDHRGENAFQEVLFGPLGSVTHAERLFIALGVFYRYEGSGAVAADMSLPILTDEWRRQARLIGLIVRLGITLAGGAAGFLKKTSLRIGQNLTLSVPATHAGLLGEVVEKRLERVARALKLESEIQIRA